MSLEENTMKMKNRRPREQQREADQLAMQLMSKGVFLIDDLTAAFQKHFANRSDVMVDRQWVTQVRYRIGKKQQALIRAENAAVSISKPETPKIEAKVVPPPPLFTKDELMMLTKAVVESKSLDSDMQLKLISKLTSAT